MVKTKKKTIAKKIKAEIANVVNTARVSRAPQNKVRALAHSVIDAGARMFPSVAPLAIPAKRLFSWVSGLGDYRVHGPQGGSIDGLALSGDVPMFGKRIEKFVEVEYREYVADVVSSSSPSQLKVDTYTINPTTSTLFPWLSTIANGFTQWEPLGMILEYKSTSSDALNSTNTQLGAVMMAVNYDADGGAYTTLNEILNSEFSSEEKPSQNFLHMVECSTKERPSKVMNCDYSHTNADVTTSNLGTLTVASRGVQGTSVNLGQLWITYKIRFHKPRLPGGLNEQTSTGKATAPCGVNYLSIEAATGVTANLLLGTNPLITGRGATLSPGLPSGVPVINQPSTNVLNIDLQRGVGAQQQYYVFLHATGTAPGNMSATLGLSSATLVSGLGDGTVNVLQSNSPTSTTNLWTVYTDSSTAADPRLQFTLISSSTTKFQVMLFQSFPGSQGLSVLYPGFATEREREIAFRRYVEEILAEKEQYVLSTPASSPRRPIVSIPPVPKAFNFKQ